MVAQLEQLFDNETLTKVELLEHELGAVLGPDVSGELIALSNMKTQNKFETIEHILLTRYDKLKVVYKNMKSVETKEEYQEGVKSFFKLIHPGDVLRDLQAALEFSDIEQDYKACVMKFGERELGELFQRYNWNDDAYKFLQAGIMSQNKVLMQSLELHAQQIATHVELLDEIKSAAVGKGLFKIGASIAGSLIAGPLGGLAARGLTNMFMGDNEEKVSKSIEEVADKWDQFSAQLYDFLEGARVKYYYTTLTLYGGTFLQVHKDLHRNNMYILDLNLMQNTYQLALNSDEELKIKKWIEVNGKELEHVLATKQIEAALVVADRFFKYIRSNSLYTKIELQNGMSALYYANILKTAAIFQLAHYHLEKKNMRNFAQIMKDYFNQAPLAMLDDDLIKYHSPDCMKLSMNYIAYCIKENKPESLRILCDYFEKMLFRVERAQQYAGEDISLRFENMYVLISHMLKDYYQIETVLLQRQIEDFFRYFNLRQIKKEYEMYGQADIFVATVKKHMRRLIIGGTKKVISKTWWIPLIIAVIWSGIYAYNSGYIEKWLNKQEAESIEQGIVSPSPALILNDRDATEINIYTVISSAANIRSQAGTQSDVVAIVQQGAKLQRIANNSEVINDTVWLNVITVDGVEGWVSIKVVEKSQ